MKKLTQLLTGTMIVLGAAALTVAKLEPKESKISHTQHPAWRKTIEIVNGITIEFESGTHFQVFVTGSKQLVSQLVSVLENKLYQAAGKNSTGSLENVRIKVIAPAFFKLEKDTGTYLHTAIYRYEKASARCKKCNNENLC